MNLQAPTINPQAACGLLLQEMGEPQSVIHVADGLQKINALRIAKQLPMVSSMSCFNPNIIVLKAHALNVNIIPIRALWERGLTLVLKHDRHAGQAQMIAACKSLTSQISDSLLSQIAQVMLSLLPLISLNDVDALIELAGRFDILLRDADHILAVPAEELLRDCLFYLSLKNPDDFVKAWDWTPQGELQLRKRLVWHAKELSHLLYPTEDTDKIDKAKIEKYYLPVTDGLLFLNEIKLRTRLLLRFEKIEERMLKIAVPIQLLMAEALRLSTGVTNPPKDTA